MKLRILYVSDLHSRYEEMAKIASIIEEIKDENTIILDIGDNSDFSRLETEGTQGKISTDILNEIGFHARVFGNNEGFVEIEIGRKMAENSLCPVITCNMYDINSQKLDYLKDYVIIDVKGLKILMIGVTAPYNEFYHLFGIHMKDPLEEIKRVLSKLSKEKYDLLILLSHLGLTHDKELVTKIANIDIIIGGHSHTVLTEPIRENDTIICQAGGYGEYLGELVIDYDKKRNIIKEFKGRLIPAANFPPHPKISDIILRNSKEAEKFLSRPLFSINATLKHSLTEENEIGNLLADALRDMFNSDIGIINSGVLNQGIDKGIITKSLLHKISPSPLNPTIIELKGSDLLITLEKSLLTKYQLMDGIGAGFRGKYVGNIQISNNVRVAFNPNKSPLNKINYVKINNTLLDPQQWYSVGTSDYLQRGTGYTDLSNCKHVKYHPDWLRDILEKYLSNKKFIKIASTKRFILQTK